MTVVELTSVILSSSAVSALATWQLLKRKYDRVVQQSLEEQRAVLDAVRRQAQEEKEQILSESRQKASELEESIAQISADRAFREMELDAIVRGQKEFAVVDTPAALSEALAQVVDASFRDDIKAFVFWSTDNGELLGANSLAKTDMRWWETAQQNCPSGQLFDGQPSRVVCADELRTCAGLDVSGLNLAYVPVSVKERLVGIVGAYFTGSTYQIRLRVLRRLLDIYANALRRILKYEEEYRVSRIDPLTNLPNSRAVYDILPPLVEASTQERPLSLFFIECDNLKEINDKYGHHVGDEMLQQLVKEMRASARLEELTAARPEDQYIRYGGLQFLMVSQEADANQALIVAERMREAVDAKIDWPCGVPKWSISIGIATAPEDAENAADLVAKAEVALMYVKEHMHGNGIIRFDQVPRHFRVSKLSAAVSGSLDVFDPATTLQSVATAQRTGILSVTNAAGRIFWAFFDSGKPLKSYLDNYRGDMAIVEFLATFEDGSFDFREYNLLDAQTMEEIHSLDESYNLKRSLERNLMDGALAQDQLAEAKRLLPNTRLYVRPHRDFRQIISSLPTSKDPPSKQEIEAMAAICKYINGRTMLSAILERLDHLPTHLRWHAAALLLRSNAIELTKLALSFAF